MITFGPEIPTRYRINRYRTIGYQYGRVAKVLRDAGLLMLATIAQHESERFHDQADDLQYHLNTTLIV